MCIQGMMRDENRMVDKRKMEKDLKELIKCALFGMHLIYSCHNNDKLTGQNQSNEHILLFGDSRGLTHAYNLKGLACKNSEPFGTTIILCTMSLGR